MLIPSIIVTPHIFVNQTSFMDDIRISGRWTLRLLGYEAPIVSSPSSTRDERFMHCSSDYFLDLVDVKYDKLLWFGIPKFDHCAWSISASQICGSPRAPKKLFVSMSRYLSIFSAVFDRLWKSKKWERCIYIYIWVHTLYICHNPYIYIYMCIYTVYIYPVFSYPLPSHAIRLSSSFHQVSPLPDPPRDRGGAQRRLTLRAMGSHGDNMAMIHKNFAILLYIIAMLQCYLYHSISM